MRKILFFICVLFFSSERIVLAGTIDITWHNIDNTTHDTTTCTVGSNLTLPTAPTKRGYTFLGWSKDQFTPLEYIESTGTQYINTGVVSSSDTRTEVSFTPMDWGGVVFGNYSEDDLVEKSNTLYIGSVRDGYLYTTDYEHYEGEIANRTSLGYISLNQTYVAVIDKKRGEASVNGTVYYLTTNTVWQGTHNMLIFARTFGSAGTVGYYGQLKLMYAKIYNNNVLVRDFIPVLDNLGTPCLYDTVTKQFFYNAGTGDFIAGPVINE